MNEDEAKKKWCPFVHAGNTLYCIGGSCMAWRWIPFQANDPAYIAALKICEHDSKMKPAQAAKFVNEHRAEFNLPTEPFDGYCGLAGVPI